MGFIQDGVYSKEELKGCKVVAIICLIGVAALIYVLVDFLVKMI